MIWRKMFSAFIIVLFFVQSNGGEIIRLTSKNLHLLPKGKEVDGMEGDWLITNDKIVVVIGAAYPDREANQMVSSIQGAVIDFTTVSANNDQLVVYYPQGARVDIASADTIIVITGKGKTVQIKVIKNPTLKEPFVAETIYTLNDGEAFLHVKTSYKNTSAKPVRVLLSDVMRCDNALNDVAPEGTGEMAFMNNKWYNAAYAVVSPDRSLYTKGKVERGNLIILGYHIFYPPNGSNPLDSTLLAPGTETSISRLLLNGQDVASIHELLPVLNRGKYRRLDITVSDKTGKTLENVFINARNKKGQLVTSSKTIQSGNSRLYMPDGQYTIQASKVGHDTVEQNVEIPSSIKNLTFSMQPEAKVTFHINGEKLLPVKVAFYGIEGTPDPFLGPETRHNGASNLYFSKWNEFEVSLPAGKYLAVLSRGPEYRFKEVYLTLENGKTLKVSTNLERLFSTPGWIIADLHSHSTSSGDSNIGLEDKVMNLVAAGIEFAPATEHNRISSYSNTIHNAGLQRYIASAAGIELSGRPGPGSINHQNAFPLKMQNGNRGYGAPKTNANPYIQMKRLFDYDQGKFKLMQQNHPDIGWLYFDKNKDGKIDSGFQTSEITDVMEISNTILDLPQALKGGNKNTRSFHWLQMLNLGYRIFGTANSDSHTIGNGVGSLFNYVYTGCDEPEKINAEEIALQFKKGHSVMSSGPFLDVRINDSLPGTSVMASDKQVNVRVKVLTSMHSPVDTIQILLNGKADGSIMFTRAKNPDLFKGFPLVFEKEIPLKLASDAHIIVMAYGERKIKTSIAFSNIRNKKDRDNLSIAVSNPFFVDVDNNGFIPNKDLLGKPLPSGMQDKTNKSSSEEL